MFAPRQAADGGADYRFAGGLDQALATITAKAAVMQYRTDLYSPPEDSEIELEHMPNAELRVILSVWPHSSGGINPENAMLLRRSCLG